MATAWYTLKLVGKNIFVHRPTSDPNKYFDTPYQSLTLSVRMTKGAIDTVYKYDNTKNKYDYTNNLWYNDTVTGNKIDDNMNTSWNFGFRDTNARKEAQYVRIAYHSESPLYSVEYDNARSWQYNYQLPPYASDIYKIPGDDINNVNVFAVDKNLILSSGICIAPGEMVLTDQGELAIEKIDPKVNTIDGKKIVGVTRTLEERKSIVCVEKGAIGKNEPSKDTLLSYRHLVLFNGKMKKAIKLSKKLDKVYTVKYDGYVYNVLMEEYYRMKVNNMVCETLHPNNKAAKLYRMMNNVK